ncbi:MAG TPA: ABC transporter permease [Vicinamibacterales bacterium]|nr:ABC transporter permease [Vicinamibacterales bacterium]
MLLRDLRYALRSLGRSPGLTAALVATVAVGIGTHAAVGGFINGLLAHGLAVPDAGRLAGIYSRDADGRYQPLTWQQYHALPQAAPSFATIAAFRESRGSVTLHGRANWMSVARATPDLWNVVRIPAALGRISFAGDGQQNAAAAIVVAARVWRNEFAAQPDAIGAEAEVDGRRARIVGVAPDWFEGIYVGRNVDVWIAFDERDAAVEERAAVGVLGRLRDGRTAADAQSEVGAALGQSTIVLAYSGTEPELQLKLTELKRVLGWAAALVFLTAAASVAGLLLSRAVRRSHETAARITLGATPARLASLVLADSLVISLCGGVFGGVVAFWTASALPAQLYVEDASRLKFAADAWQIARIAAGYSGLMLLCGLAPLMQMRRQGPMDVLRRTGGGSMTAMSGPRSLLVVGQMCTCIILVVGAALVFQAFRQSLRTVRADRLGDPIVATLEASGGYSRPEAGQDYFLRAEQALLRVPGVNATAWAGTLPGARPSSATLRFEPRPIGWRDVSVDAMIPEGRDLLAFTLKGGRMFRGGDGRLACRAALVNEAMAARYFEGNAVGRSMRSAAGRRIDIVGVVDPPPRWHQSEEPAVYFYETQELATPSREVKTARLAIGIHDAAAREELSEIDVNVASPPYFDAVGAKVSAGRTFSTSAEPDGCDVAMVNLEAAATYFGGDALGGAVIDGDGNRTEIIGVVDAGALRVTGRRPDPTVYYPMRQRFIPLMTLIGGTQRASPELIAAISRELRGVAGGAHDPLVLTLDEHNARTSLGPERIATLLVGTCAVIALSLAILGVYGVMSDAVLQKKRDIALRLALGAGAPTIVAGVVREGLRIAATGAATGLAAAWLLVQFLRHRNAALHAPEAWTWLACPLVLLAIVAVASVLPARWALAVDPLTITRDE